MATPLTADQLLAALTAEGVTVAEVADWRTHDRNAVGAWGPVNGVVMHHTVTGPGVDVVSVIYDGDADLPGPWAHGCITKDGTVHLTSAGRANHAGGGDPNVLQAVVAESYEGYPPAPHEHEGSTGAVDGNTHFYGFECENLGDGRDPWPLVQYAAMVRAAAAVCRGHGWDLKSVIGHLEWSDWKSDPCGFDMRDFREDVAACLRLPAGQWRKVLGTPQYVDLAVAAPFDLAPGQDWTAIAFATEAVDETGDHADGAPEFVTGAARFMGELSVHASGIPAGSQLQVRQTETDTSGAGVADGPIGEIPGTDGDTYGTVPIAGHIDAGRQMTVRLKAFEDTAVTIASAVLKVLVWKEA